MLVFSAECAEVKKTELIEGLEGENWVASEIFSVGGGKCVTQIVNLSTELPSESVILAGPSSFAAGVPEKVKLEKESQSGRDDAVTF